MQNKLELEVIKLKQLVEDLERWLGAKCTNYDNERLHFYKKDILLFSIFNNDGCWIDVEFSNETTPMFNTMQRITKVMSSMNKIRLTKNKWAR